MSDLGTLLQKGTTKPGYRASSLTLVNAEGGDAHCDVAAVIVDEPLREDAVEAGVGALEERGLGVTIVHTEHARPERPSVVGCTLCRRPTHELQVYDVPADDVILTSESDCSRVCA